MEVSLFSILLEVALATKTAMDNAPLFDFKNNRNFFRCVFLRSVVKKTQLFSLVNARFTCGNFQQVKRAQISAFMSHFVFKSVCPELTISSFI